MPKFKVMALCLIALLCPSAGCVKWFKGKVANGVARLTTRHMGTVLLITADDTRCGFESPQVKNNPILRGKVGEYGSAVFHVVECRMEFDEPTIVDEDCNGTQKSAEGAITVTATMEVRGRLTGSKEDPVVPESTDSATIHFTRVEFEDFEVRDSASDKYMIIRSGVGAGSISPMLLEDESAGACSVPVPAVRFQNINLSDASVKVFTPKRNFDTHVNRTDFHAVSGPFGNRENWLQGSVTVWGKSKGVGGENAKLDPDYDPDIFHASYACEEDLAVPVQTDCDLTEHLGFGAARLSVRTLAALAKALDKDERCGFSSPEVKYGYQAIGNLGTPGTVIYDLGAGCELDFPLPTSVYSDCNGAHWMASGRAVVRGTMTVDGYLSGDPEEPVVPTHGLPAKVELSADLSNFLVRDTSREEALDVIQGTLSGALEPRTGIDSETGICSIPLPIARFTGVTWGPESIVDVLSKDARLGITIQGSRFDAINGTMDGTTNEISGQITVDGRELTIPHDDRALDPDFHGANFFDSYACEDNLELPSDDIDCEIYDVLGQGVARLIVKTFGNITKHIDKDLECGFGGIDGVLPEDVTGEPGELLTARWQVQNCVIQGPQLVHEDCHGTQTTLHGTMEVDATKTATGAVVLGNPPLHPEDRLSAPLDIYRIVLNNFSIREQKVGVLGEEPYLYLHYAEMRGIALPVTGEALDVEHAYHVKTDVSGFEDIVVSNAVGQLRAEGKTFNVQISNAHLDAFNGSYGGHSNELTGTITIDGVPMNIPVDDDEHELNPDFDQSYFDIAEACRLNLREPVPFDEVPPRRAR